MPQANIFFLPWMSACLPKGTRNMAAARMYDVGTQLISTALIRNSLLMAGSAMLMDETIKRVRKEESAAMSRTERFIVASFILGSRGLPDDGIRSPPYLNLLMRYRTRLMILIMMPVEGNTGVIIPLDNEVSAISPERRFLDAEHHQARQ
jgi:hypothetical protein